MKSTTDFIDFWNYRILNTKVIAIPLQWFDDLLDFCKEFIKKHTRTFASGSKDFPQIVFSNSIPIAIRDELLKQLRSETSGRIILEKYDLPARFFRYQSSVVYKPSRIVAQAKNFNIPIKTDELKIQFETLSPDFAREYIFRYKYRWANVINMNNGKKSGRIATVFPPNYRDSNFPKIKSGTEPIILSSEGLIIFPKFKNTTENWNLIDGNSAFNHWFERRNVKTSSSVSGRATKKIIQTLGLSNLHAIAKRSIINLLDEVARVPIKRSMKAKEFRNKIQNGIKDDKWYTDVFEILVNHGVVELGSEVQCSKCGNWNWYPHITPHLTCDLCRKIFDFPKTTPDETYWAYRVAGPFALPKYADGGYAAALTLRLFTSILSTEVTWSAGQELCLSDGTKFEIDLLLWLQEERVWGRDNQPELLFIEAKSFIKKNGFKTRDIQRMKRLAKEFPGCTLVFSTMSEAEDLPEVQKQELRKIAYWSRKYDSKRRQRRANIIILTGTELFASFDLKSSWIEKGGKQAEIMSLSLINPASLGSLADITQQVYLEMPSMHA